MPEPYNRGEDRTRLPRDAAEGKSDKMPTSIDKHELQKLIRQGSAQLVEVLPTAEFEEAHLAGAVNIPLKELNRESTSALNKDAPVIVY